MDDYDDELSEFDVTEAEFDARFARAQPVVLVQAIRTIRPAKTRAAPVRVVLSGKVRTSQTAGLSVEVTTS